MSIYRSSESQYLGYVPQYDNTYPPPPPIPKKSAIIFACQTKYFVEQKDFLRRSREQASSRFLRLPPSWERRVMRIPRSEFYMCVFSCIVYRRNTRNRAKNERVKKRQPFQNSRCVLAWRVYTFLRQRFGRPRVERRQTLKTNMVAGLPFCKLFVVCTGNSPW